MVVPFLSYLAVISDPDLAVYCIDEPDSGSCFLFFLIFIGAASKSENLIFDG